MSVTDTEESGTWNRGKLYILAGWEGLRVASGNLREKERLLPTGRHPQWCPLLVSGGPFQALNESILRNSGNHKGRLSINAIGAPFPLVTRQKAEQFILHCWFQYTFTVSSC